MATYLCELIIGLKHGSRYPLNMFSSELLKYTFSMLAISSTKMPVNIDMDYLASWRFLLNDRLCLIDYG